MESASTRLGGTGVSTQGRHPLKKRCKAKRSPFWNGKKRIFNSRGRLHWRHTLSRAYVSWNNTCAGLDQRLHVPIKIWFGFCIHVCSYQLGIVYKTNSIRKLFFRLDSHDHCSRGAKVRGRSREVPSWNCVIFDLGKSFLEVRFVLSRSAARVVRNVRGEQGRFSCRSYTWEGSTELCGA